MCGPELAAPEAVAALCGPELAAPEAVADWCGPELAAPEAVAAVGGGVDSEALLTKSENLFAARQFALHKENAFKFRDLF